MFAAVLAGPKNGCRDTAPGPDRGRENLANVRGDDLAKFQMCQCCHTSAHGRVLGVGNAFMSAPISAMRTSAEA